MKTTINTINKPDIAFRKKLEYARAKVSFEKKHTAEDEEDEPLADPETELTDEIRAFRKKNKEFQSTNDHQTYLIVVFSTKEDKEEFLTEAKLSGKHTLVDGYELAKSLSLHPIAPKFKLQKPF
jgi:hypothetical protein